MAQNNEVDGIKDDDIPIIFGCTKPAGTYDYDYFNGYKYLIISPPTLPPPPGAQMSAFYYIEEWTFVAGFTQSVYKKGPCYGIRSLITDPTDTTPDDGTLSPLDPVLEPADPVLDPPTQNCPTIEQIEIDFNGNVTFNGTPLSPTCCTKDIVGSEVIYVTSSNNLIGSCILKTSNDCLPQEQLAISLDYTVIGVTNPECCTVENTGINNVTWDYNKGKCMVSIPETEPCNFLSYITERVEEISVDQVFGIDEFNNNISLSQSCCNSETIGFDVEWDSNFNLCKKLIQPGTEQPSIILNEELLVIGDCEDLLVSAKLYFGQPEEGCFTDSISASLLPSNSSYTVEQLGIFDSSTDGFDTWVDLGIRISNFTSGDTFNLKLNLIGLTTCCDYDIRVDNIRLDCYKEEDRVFYDNKKCPGFDLKRVIDNKKSWVYNPGTIDVGVSDYDVLTRARGDLSLLEKFGFVNRKFAPSLDADIPWRYTDYYEQSNILEPHSKAVINSKEMELTFNMCGTCCYEYQPCPKGYTLSAGTDTCYKYVVSKQFQDDEEFEFQDGEYYDFMDFENT